MSRIHTSSQIRGNTPSTISITRQFHFCISHPERGEEMTSERGTASENHPFARARSLLGNQWESKTSVAGYMPPSPTPSKNRITHSSCQVCTSPQPTEAHPQIISKMLTIHLVLQRLAR